MRLVLALGLLSAFAGAAPALNDAGPGGSVARPATDAAGAPAGGPPPAPAPSTREPGTASVAPAGEDEAAKAAAGDAPARPGPATAPAPPATAGAPSAAPAPPGAATSRTMPSPRVAELHGRVEALLARAAVGRDVTADADRLFDEVAAALWATQREVLAEIEADAPELLARHADMIALYAERDALLEVVSDGLHERTVGAGPAGRASLRRELSYVRTRLLYQLRVIRHGLGQIAANVSESPLDTFWRVLELGLALVLFRSWRSWSRRGLKDTRMRLLAIRPRQAVNIRLARALWYLDRVGGPLAWLILLVVIEQLVSPRGFEELTSLVYTVLVWIFVARLVVQLIDALAARGVGGLGTERAALRLRSLRLLASWTVLLGLGNSLVTRYAGHGAVYAWAFRAWVLLSLPVALVLISWWRDEIAARLEALAADLPVARWLAAKRSGIWGYPLSIAGGAYLVWVELSDRMLKRVARWEMGRRFVTVLVRREAERDVLRSREDDEEPVPEDVAARLLDASDARVESVGRAARARVDAILDDHRGGACVVVGERGVGKTAFLERLAQERGDTMRLVGCPTTGYAGLEAALAAAFGVAEGDGLPDRLARAIDASGVVAIAIDDAHRLARPWMGGQAGMERLIALIGLLRTPVDIVLGVDDVAWRYIALLRGDRALFQEVVRLPAWSEEALGALVSARAKACGIDPDFGRIVLPRQLDAGEYKSLEERNRFGYARILWELADGNPEVALRTFAGSLRRTADGAIVVRLPQPVFSMALNDAAVDTLLVLRVALQCDGATIEDVARSLRVSPARAESTIRFALQNDWLEEFEGGYRVAWSWFRPITRTLVRRNLMAR